MTTITLPRAVVEQALEALKDDQDRMVETAEGHWEYKTDLAIGALKAALAQQAEPVEPVAHRVVAGALFDFMGWLTSRRERLVLSSTDDAVPAADAIKDFAEMRGLSLDDAKVQDWNAAPPQQAEPVEPYCYVYEYDGVFGLHREFYPLPYNGMKPSRTVPVYTAPLQRKPLTEGVLMGVYIDFDRAADSAWSTAEYLLRLFRAVEHAHGIKE